MNKDKLNAVLVGILIIVAYAVLDAEILESKAWVMFWEVISGLAVIGIAILMYPYFRKYGESLTNSYLTLKTVEGALMVAGGILFFYSLLNLRTFLYLVHVHAFWISALFFYLLLQKAKLVPRYIVTWGYVSIVCLLIVNVLEYFIAEAWIQILYLPIITNEFYLAIYLMMKGFKLK